MFVNKLQDVIIIIYLVVLPTNPFKHRTPCPSSFLFSFSVSFFLEFDDDSCPKSSGVTVRLVGHEGEGRGLREDSGLKFHNLQI
jgi:hypothetical protein